MFNVGPQSVTSIGPKPSENAPDSQLKVKSAVGLVDRTRSAVLQAGIATSLANRPQIMRESMVGGEAHGSENSESADKNSWRSRLLSEFGSSRTPRFIVENLDLQRRGHHSAKTVNLCVSTRRNERPSLQAQHRPSKRKRTKTCRSSNSTRKNEGNLTQCLKPCCVVCMVWVRTVTIASHVRFTRLHREKRICESNDRRSLPHACTQFCFKHFMSKNTCTCEKTGKSDI